MKDILLFPMLKAGSQLRFETPDEMVVVLSYNLDEQKFSVTVLDSQGDIDTVEHYEEYEMRAAVNSFKQFATGVK